MRCKQRSVVSTTGLIAATRRVTIFPFKWHFVRALNSATDGGCSSKAEAPAAWCLEKDRTLLSCQQQPTIIPAVKTTSNFKSPDKEDRIQKLMMQQLVDPSTYKSFQHHYSEGHLALA